MASTKKPRQNAFLLRCSKKEADLIRETARRERRSINAFILHSILIRLEIHRRTDERLGRSDTSRRNLTTGL